MAREILQQWVGLCNSACPSFRRLGIAFRQIAVGQCSRHCERPSQGGVCVRGYPFLGTILRVEMLLRISEREPRKY